MNEVFRCDYCGMLAPLSRARISAVYDYTSFTNEVFTVSVTCGDYCNSRLQTSATRVGGR